MVELCRARGLSVATAESLTGGGLAATLTEVPGASAVYVGGVVSYATRVKQQVLGVPAAVVEQHGVVSAGCAAAMAEGARSLLGTDLAVSTTGVAGPDSQEGKPVGLVYVAVADRSGTETRELHLAGDREAIRRLAGDLALRLLEERVTSLPIR